MIPSCSNQVGRRCYVEQFYVFTIEMEYIGTIEAAKKAIWLIGLLRVV